MRRDWVLWVCGPPRALVCHVGRVTSHHIVPLTCGVEWSRIDCRVEFVSSTGPSLLDQPTHLQMSSKVMQ